MTKATRIPYTHLTATARTLTTVYAEVEQVATLLVRDRGDKSLVARRALIVLREIDRLREALMPAAREWTGSEDRAQILFYGRDQIVTSDRDATVNEFGGSSPPDEDES